MDANGKKSRSCGLDLVLLFTICFWNIVKGCLKHKPADYEDGNNDK